MSFVDNFKQYSYPLFGLVRLPEVKIENEDKEKIKISSSSSNTAYLKHLAWNGFLAKKTKGEFQDVKEQDIKDRLKMEFSVFEKTNIIDYLLLVQDILAWCDEEGIARGPGRGSVCGSLTAYLIGVTKVDPIKHKLNFTRFLSEARAKPKVIDGITYADGKSLCDIDSDISFVNRPRVIEYVENKYKGRTCKIATRLQLTGKTALKDTLKIFLGFDETKAKHVTDLVESQFGKVEDLSKAIEKHKDLKTWIEEDKLNREAFDIARGLEGLNIAKGQHPSGVFISYDILDGNIPIELSKTKDIVTSNDMNMAAQLGVKIDLLGLRSVDLIQEASKEAGITELDININDETIYKYLSNSDLYYGLFQIESGLTKEVVKKVGPRFIDDLAACLALSRPGSLRYINDFVNFIKKDEYKTIYPAIDEILKVTGNILLYQEQINDICQKVYKMTAVEGDEVRRAIGKKIKEDMAKWEPVLYENGKKEGIPEEVTKYFWDVCNASADYLFSVNHSTGYAYITAQTAYLKAYYPNEFIFALLKLSKHEPNSLEVLNSVIMEAKQMGIKILPPDLIKSKNDFSIEKEGIRFGLSHIKGVSDTTMEKLTNFRREYANKIEIFEAASQSGVSIALLSSLIFCGALNIEGSSRARLVLEAQTYNLLKTRTRLKTLVHKLAPTFNYDVLLTIKDLSEKTDDKGKPYIPERTWKAFQRDYEPFKKMYMENKKSDELCELITERFFLGFSYSHTLHSIFSKKIDGLTTVQQANEELKETKVKFVCFVNDFKKSTSVSTKKTYYKYFISDETGSCKVMLYGDQKISACEQFNGKLPEKEDILIVHGTKGDGDMVFANDIIIHENPIKIKKRDLEK